jgi:hypothetical protein
MRTFAIGCPLQADQDFLRLPRTGPAQAALVSVTTRPATLGTSHYPPVRLSIKLTTHLSHQLLEIPSAVDGITVHGVTRR